MFTYRDDLPPVIKGINAKIASNEKIGLVGRTGSGKSSFFQALFRIVEPLSGTIKLDGVDFTSVGLAELRRKISIIPQEPVLFSGTVRENLDPFNEYEDHQLWAVLERAYLKNAVSLSPEKLGMHVDENGENFRFVCASHSFIF